MLIDAANGLAPAVNKFYTLGSPSLLWDEVYASNATINTSDRRLKKNIAPPFVRPHRNPAAQSQHLQVGAMRRTVQRIWVSIAQEVLHVIPEIVVVPEEGKGHLGIRYSELIPVLIKAVQELDEISRLQGTEIIRLQSLLAEGH